MRPVAPWWHTILLVVLFLAVAAGGAAFRQSAPAHSGAHPNVVPLYLSMIVMEWGLVLYVWRAGLRRSGTSLRELIGGRWSSTNAVLIDLALALGLLGVWKLLDLGWAHSFGPNHAASIDNLLPQKAPFETVLWILVSMSAGFCEELVFRGYFLRQFAAIARHAGVAILMQGALFGIAHGYQGARACLTIAAYGILYGLLAHWRRSLRPGMIAHAWTDILSGLLRF